MDTFIPAPLGVFRTAVGKRTACPLSQRRSRLHTVGNERRDETLCVGIARVLKKKTVSMLHGPPSTEDKNPIRIGSDPDVMGDE
jgi:hypothetical protein